jgi:hypothetical protein
MIFKNLDNKKLPNCLSRVLLPWHSVSQQEKNVESTFGQIRNTSRWKDWLFNNVNTKMGTEQTVWNTTVWKKGKTVFNFSNSFSKTNDCLNYSYSEGGVIKLEVNMISYYIPEKQSVLYHLVFILVPPSILC